MGRPGGGGAWVARHAPSVAVVAHGEAALSPATGFPVTAKERARSAARLSISRAKVRVASR
jgi:hypothetical protein